MASSPRLVLVWAGMTLIVGIWLPMRWPWTRFSFSWAGSIGLRVTFSLPLAATGSLLQPLLQRGLRARPLLGGLGQPQMAQDCFQGQLLLAGLGEKPVNYDLD